MERRIFVLAVSLAVFFCGCQKTGRKKTPAALPEPGPAESSPVAEMSETLSAAPVGQAAPAEIPAPPPVRLGMKGGVSVFGGEICPVPEGFRSQKFRITGIDGDLSRPDKPFEEISITPSEETDFISIRLPAEVYEEYPELYVEAEHDGKLFVCDGGDALQFREESDYDGNLMGYSASVVFANRNLHSRSDDWTVRLKNRKDSAVIAQEAVIKEALPCGYAVYSEEYESPFVEPESSSVEPDKKMHMLYKGDMAVFSYCYQYDYRSKLLYVPFLAVRAEADGDDGVRSFAFSIREPGQYKVDFYDSASGEARYTSAFDYISVEGNKGNGYGMTADGDAWTEWKVDSSEGLWLRNMPWGEKISLLPDGMVVIQTERTMLPFSDCIDGEEGFWVPVHIKLRTDSYEPKETKEVFCDNENDTDGWVFSGFLTGPDS